MKRRSRVVTARGVNCIFGAQWNKRVGKAHSKGGYRYCSSITMEPLINKFEAIKNCRIVDSTLREGEQFANMEYTTNDRLYIAKSLDNMGIDYIEVVNPIASNNAVLEAQAIKNLNLKKSKLLTHIRCHMLDAKAAVEAGVDGVNMFMATSEALRKHSHGKGIDAIIETAQEVISYLQKHNVEIRFSCEDTFRSDKTDLLKIYAAVDQLGIDRVGLADTVGIATPLEVYNSVLAVRSVISPSTGIEFHGHNDTGCCISNAYMALLAGATHIDTTVLGLGERNGITPLGGFLGRLYTIDKDEIMSRYNLEHLRHLEKFVAHCSSVQIPFNNYITGSTAFTHKAGVHSKAVMADPAAYEVINPAHFGIDRHIQLAHRLTGWNAMQARAKQLNLDIDPVALKAATSMIKNLADDQGITLDQIDSVLIELASGPKINSSSFIEWKAGDEEVDPNLRAAFEETAKQLAKFEKMRAAKAVKSVSELKREVKKAITVKLEGHLFDKAVLNRVLDLLVDRNCEFEVLSLDIPQTNDRISSATVQLWSKDQEKLREVKTALASLVKSLSDFAESSIVEVNPDHLQS